MIMIMIMMMMMIIITMVYPITMGYAILCFCKTGNGEQDAVITNLIRRCTFK